MELFVLRHGHAEPEALKDSLRELTSQGRTEVKASVLAKIDALSAVQKVLVSPYVRAQQTAKIVLDELGAKGFASAEAVSKREETRLLVPGGSPHKLIEYLHSLFHQQNHDSILLVGHQPLLGTLVDELCGFETGVHRLATASVVAIDFDVLAVACCRARWFHHSH